MLHDAISCSRQVLGLAPGAGAVITNGRVVVADAPTSADAALPKPLVAGDFALLQVHLGSSLPHGLSCVGWSCRCFAVQYPYLP